jgi:hypothetical protein
MKRISVFPPVWVLVVTFSLASVGFLSAAVSALGDPLPTGACCWADGSCTIQTQEDCAQQGGVWQGGESGCTPNPCPGCLMPCTSGACCLPNGQCEWVIQTVCQQAGGTFQGGGTICAPNPCGTASTPDPDVKESGMTWGKLRIMYR